MKRLISFLFAMLIVLTVSAGALAAYKPDVNYLELMVEAAVTGDYEAGNAAEVARNLKIDEGKYNYAKIDFDDLMLLSKIIYAEAGSVWLSEEWKMCVGEVVLNRVASPEFPNTLKEVLEQPGQYYGANSRYFNSLIPSEACVRAAIRLLNGERLMDPSVVFQANFKQGSGTHTAIYDKYLGWTYFCFSSKPELYSEALPEDDAQILEAAEDLPSDPAESELVS